MSPLGEPLEDMDKVFRAFRLRPTLSWWRLVTQLYTSRRRRIRSSSGHTTSGGSGPSNSAQYLLSPGCSSGEGRREGHSGGGNGVVGPRGGGNVPVGQGLSRALSFNSLAGEAPPPTKTHRPPRLHKYSAPLSKQPFQLYFEDADEVGEQLGRL